MKKKHYNFRWIPRDSAASIANVSLTASHDTNAKRQADKIARELGVTNTPRMMTCEGRTIEFLNKGTTS